MKHLLILIMLVFGVYTAGAQVVTKKAQSKRTTTAKQRGTGQYHGSRDTTPGSPMGTGGAGGNDMSGSPAGSAIETKDQTDKGQVKGSSGKQAGTKKSTNHRKKSIIRKTTQHKKQENSNS